MSDFELDRSVNRLIFVYQTGRNIDKFSLKCVSHFSSVELNSAFHVDLPRLERPEPNVKERDSDYRDSSI